MAIRADHHPARKRVLFENDLMNDAAPRHPETSAELGAYALEKVVDLLIAFACREKVSFAVIARLDEMITVSGGGYRDLRKSGIHELKPSHLSRGILHCYAVWAKVRIADTSI